MVHNVKFIQVILSQIDPRVRTSVSESESSCSRSKEPLSLKVRDQLVLKLETSWSSSLELVSPRVTDQMVLESRCVCGALLSQKEFNPDF